MREKLIRFPTHVIDNGVLAFPRLRLPTTGLDYGEVDVLATLGDGLHVIEVMTRKSEKGVEDKLVKLQQIRTALNADEILLITTKENLEELEKTDHCNGIKCIALENLPRDARRADYEVELAVVVGRRGRYVGRGEVMDYVFGYTVFNDVTIRERQSPLPKSPRLGLRWLPGKNFDTSGPVGPYLVTKDEVPDPHNLRIGMRVSGEVRQDGTTADMVFKIPEIIEAVSDGLTLEPGDLIATGTPSGVGAGTGKYLRHGDVMEAWVERVGTLINPVVFEEFES